MGKYMRTGKPVGKMAAIEGTTGVKTRARTQSLGKELHNPDSRRLRQQQSNASSACATSFERYPRPHEDDNNYMQLRSRRLGKSVLKCVNSKGPEEFKSSIFRGVDVTLTKSRVLRERNQIGENAKSNTRNSRHGFLFTAGREAHISLASSHISLPSSGRGSVSSRNTQTKVASSPSIRSRSNSVSVFDETRSGILTRNRKQELENFASQDMMVLDTEEFFVLRTSRTSSHDMNLEMEPFFGESQLPVRQQRLSLNKESTPDSYLPDCEAPGSTSRNRRHRTYCHHNGNGRGRVRSSHSPFGRTNEGPSCSEIDAFFEGAEQRERRRFTERYNFDPVNERPLRGRYEWMIM